MEFTRWVRESYPALADVFCHYPAGGNRHWKTGKLMKDMGQATGWPDMQMAAPAIIGFGVFPIEHVHGGIECIYPALYIEIKRDKGPSPDKGQQERIKALRKRRNAVAVCYGLEECKTAFTAYVKGGTEDEPARKLFKTITRSERKDYDKHCSSVRSK